MLSLFGKFEFLFTCVRTSAVVCLRDSLIIITSKIWYFSISSNRVILSSATKPKDNCVNLLLVDIKLILHVTQRFFSSIFDCLHCKSELNISNFLVILANEIKSYLLQFKMIELCCQINLRKCGLIMGYSSIIGGCVSMLTSIGNPTNSLTSDCKIFETLTFCKWKWSISF